MLQDEHLCTCVSLFLSHVMTGRETVTTEENHEKLDGCDVGLEKYNKAESTFARISFLEKRAALSLSGIASKLQF